MGFVKSCHEISRRFLRPVFLLPVLLIWSSFNFEVWSQEVVLAPDTIVSEAALLLGEYVQYASVTGNERDAGIYLSDLCRDKGLYVEIFTDSVDSYNFAASLYPLDLQKPNVILLSHIDVVNGGADSLWTHPPFSGVIVEDTIWGRGTIDMKSTSIMHLIAVSSFTSRASAEDIPFNVSLLVVSGEETYGRRGAGIISSYFMPELNAVVVLGEGGIGTTGLLSEEPDRPVFFISLNDKKALWLELEVDYLVSGHGAVPPPDYATRMMIQSLHNVTRRKPHIRYSHDNKAMLRAYGDLEKGVTGFVLRHPVFFRPLVASGLRKDPLLSSAFTNTITITNLSSEETSVNQIPQKVKAFLDCRLLPETNTDLFLKNLTGSLDNEEVSVRIINQTRTASSTIPDHYYDTFTESLTEVYPGCASIPFLFPATTDNNYFRNHGVAVYGIIPMVLSQNLLGTIHTYNERLPVESLDKGIEVYRRFIEKLMPEIEEEDAPSGVSELQDIP